MLSFTLTILVILNCVYCRTTSLSDNLKKLDEDDVDLSGFPNRLVRNKTDNEIAQEETAEYWKQNAIRVINQKLLKKLNEGVAKNVILFLGDGMSIPTISATRVLLGGEEESLSFEKFPYTGLSKTYCVDHQTADSACSATAYLCGVKANLGTLGVTAAVRKRNCTAMNDKSNHVDSIARLFQLKGKSTGFVTTTRVTHASPAAVYAHTAARHWECDADVSKAGEDPQECEDIAHQLVFGETGRNLKLILGGGRKKFLPKEVNDEENVPGQREDHVNLIEEWKKQRELSGERYEYIWNRDQLLNISSGTESVLGLLEPGHMKFNLDRDTSTEPSLAEMTEAAIKILKNNNKGFFLFVEGGRIDSAHHHSWAHKALDETAEFAKAVDKALQMTDSDETLIVVTSDHAHTMSYAGYALRGSDVFGYAGRGTDKNLYAILNYANGPGYRPVGEDGTRYVPTESELNEIGFSWPATSPMKKETHGADDVAIFANGPWAHLFTGVLEENVIPHLMAFASCTSSDYKCDYQPKLA